MTAAPQASSRAPSRTDEPGGRLLVVEDEARIRAIVIRLFEADGYTVEAVGDAETALERIADLAPDVALLDLALPGMDGIELLGRLKAEQPRLQAVIMTAHGSIASAVEAMRLGAFDYVTKPFDNTELKLVVGRALALARLEARVETLEGQLEERFRPENMVGTSGAMADIFQRIAKIAPLDTTVLIQGESGTGKELVARAVHRYSKRKDGPFVAVNCGAIPPTLVESEFFGHERGAFTGARERRRGRIELAGGGTLFLDEVADLPANAQVGLLRVLEERELVRVGGERPIPTDVRIIAASNVDLAEAVEEGTFREDLFWRLNVVAFRIPPLRERREDVPLLADHFLRRFTTKLDRPDVAGFDPTALSLLVAHDWPGNVRELENTIEHAVALASGTTVAAEDLPPRLRVGLRAGSRRGGPTTAAQPGQTGAAEAGPGDASPAQGPLQQAVARAQEAVERRMIEDALARAGGNRTEAAKALGVSRRTLFTKIRDLGVRPDARGPEEEDASGSR